VAAAALAAVGSFAAAASSWPAAVTSSCPRGAIAAIVKGNFACLRVGANCHARDQATYRRYGFSCSEGRLRKYVKPRPAPTTTVVVTTSAPPPPAFETGHYVGTTSQFQPISFDVTTSGLQNVTSGDVNGSCNPQFNLYGGNLDIPSWPINPDGSFTVKWSYSGAVTVTGGRQSGQTGTEQGTTDFEGRVQGAIAAGTLKEDSTIELASVGYVCSSGLVTWSATLSQ
jgi:hypothetical protein